MKQRLSTQLVICLILAAALFLPSHANAFWGEDKDKSCPMQKFMYDFFDITAEQQEALEALDDQQRADIQPYIENMRELSELFSEALLAADIDTEIAEELIADMVGENTELQVIALNGKIDAAQVLTAAQRADIQEVLTDINNFIDYILAYPQLEEIKEKFAQRIKDAMPERRNDLNLTDEQKDALADLKETASADAEPFAEDMEALKDDFTETLLAEVIDIDVAAALIADMEETSSTIMTIEMNAQLDAAQVLTPEQREAIAEKKNHRR